MTITTDLGTFEVIDPDYALVCELPTSTPHWQCLNVDQLLLPAPQRGTQAKPMPGADGAVVFALYDDVREVTLKLVLNAWLDEIGSPFDSQREGLLDAIEWWGGMVRAEGEVSIPSLGLAAECRVLDVAWPSELKDGDQMLVRLQLPTGRLVAGGS